MLLIAATLAIRAGAIDVAAETDLLARLRASEVCPTEEHCWPPETSVYLHGIRPGGDDGVQVPVGSSSRLYLRITQRCRLEMSFKTVGTSLSAWLKTDHEREVAVYRESEEAGGWQTASIDLCPWMGKVVRLTLRPEARGEASDRRCTVRALATHPEDDPGPRPSPPPRNDRPNVVLYVIDTLRADHLGCYGYGRSTSPRIDELAASSLVFGDAVAQSSWTLPATASILTGLIPPHHGAIDVDTALRPDIPTIAGLLHSSGYRTAAFVTNFLASSVFGAHRGFDELHFYGEQPARRSTVYLPSSALWRRVRRWLDRNLGPQPTFLYVHATDPHWPYLPPLRFARRFHAGLTNEAEHTLVRDAQSYFFGRENHGLRPTSLSSERAATLRDLYDGEIRLADEFFGRFVDELKRRDRLDHTVIVLTSDHGEEFLDHDGLGHGQTLHEEVVHVPLVVRVPWAFAGSRVDRTVQQVDIAPTILDLTGTPVPPGLDGCSLLAPLGDADDEEAYSHLDHLGWRSDALTTASWRIIRQLPGRPAQAARVLGFDRPRDRGEQHDVGPVSPVLAGWGRQQLRRFAAQRQEGPAVDPQQLERLRALGYVGQ